MCAIFRRRTSGSLPKVFVSRGHFSMHRLFLLITALLLPLAGTGCAIVEVGVRNPVIGLETVAVAPFFNLSQERTVDGREFGLAYYSELQKIPGFEVLPVGVTERAMLENGITLSGPEDAVRLARILDVDAVVVGAVTDYDPYNPRIGLKVAWYSPRQWLFLPNEDPGVPFFKRSADAPVKQPGRPSYGAARAQSPDDQNQWSSVEFGSSIVIDDDNWVSVGFEEDVPKPAGPEAVLAQIQPFLPEGTSLLVPAGRTSFPRLPLPVPATLPVAGTESEKVHQTDRIIRAGYEELANSNATDWPVPAPAAEEIPAPAAEEIVPVQATSVAPPAPFPQPRNDSSSRGPLTTESTQSPIANPFNRHVPSATPSAAPPSPTSPLNSNNGEGERVPQVADSAGRPSASGSAAAGPLSSGADANRSGAAVPAPVPPDQSAAPDAPSPGVVAPAMTTPLFPIPAPDANRVPVQPPGEPVPGYIVGEQVMVAPTDFEPTEPLMAYVRLFDATDRRLIARLSDYLELTGQLRSGDLEAYMKRSEFFRKFTAHVMISEMLQLHGGEARRQLVLKPRRYR